MRRLLSIVVAVAIAGAAYVGYPYWTLHRIEAALLSRDVAVLETLVDWPQVRSGLKTDLRTLLTSAIDKSAAANNDMANWGALIGATLGGTMIEVMVDARVSAAALADGWHERTRFRELKPQDFVAGTWFESPSVFRVDLRDPTDQQAPGVAVKLEFAGFSWRVTRVVIPLQALQDAMVGRPGETFRGIGTK